MLILKYFLYPMHSSLESFHDHAIVMVSKYGDVEWIELFSYNTMVCCIKKNILKINGTYSNTTIKHIKEFILQNKNKIKDYDKYFKVKGLSHVDKGHMEKYIEKFKGSDIEKEYEEYLNKFYDGKVYYRDKIS